MIPHYTRPGRRVRRHHAASAKINPNEVTPIQRRLTRELGRLTGVFGNVSLNPPATFAELFHHAVQLVFDFAWPGDGVVNQERIHIFMSRNPPQ
jgi:hypothetical protein